MNNVKILAVAAMAALLCQASSSLQSEQPVLSQQPKLASRHAPILTQFGLQFRDLNRNGQIDGYEDWRLPVDLRVADLVSRLTLEEKVGLLLHPSVEGFMGADGALLVTASVMVGVYTIVDPDGPDVLLARPGDAVSFETTADENGGRLVRGFTDAALAR